MFRAKTVFVLGAGASAEVDLPIGPDLLKEIVSLIDIRFDYNRQNKGDFSIVSALKTYLNEGRNVTEFNEHLHAARQIGTSAKQGLSIDNIVDGLEDPKVTLIAKLGIVRAIHMAEHKSKKFKRPDVFEPLNFEGFSGTWYDKLTKLLCEGRRKSDLNQIFENLAFVSFNYDRCIEAYLPYSIANYYCVPAPTVIEPFKSVKIHRPYGIAGEINFGPQSIIGFGQQESDYLSKAASKIRTFTEGVPDPNFLTEIKGTLEEADRIVF